MHNEYCAKKELKCRKWREIKNGKCENMWFILNVQISFPGCNDEDIADKYYVGLLENSETKNLWGAYNKLCKLFEDRSTEYSNLVNNNPFYCAKKKSEKYWVFSIPTKSYYKFRDLEMPDDKYWYDWDYLRYIGVWSSPLSPGTYNPREFDYYSTMVPNKVLSIEIPNICNSNDNTSYIRCRWNIPLSNGQARYEEIKNECNYTENGNHNWANTCVNREYIYKKCTEWSRWQENCEEITEKCKRH